MPARSTIVELLQTVVITFAAYMIIHLFLVQPNKVDGSSMVPSLYTSERILTSKLTYRFNEPARGDMVVFTPPAHLNGDYIKRIIAIPGDTILIEAGEVYINNQKLVESYLPPYTRTVERAYLREGVPHSVAADEYVVLGDNRNLSSDSRDWGPIKKSAIIGKAWARYWPLTEIEILNH